ncbi:MAG: YaeQ family protein [Burkholderiaceae bacterium]
MALKSTIYKAELQIADIDRGYYRDHALTLARHPSETDERMMMRVFAFLEHADEALAFGNGLSTTDEPDLWRHDLAGDIIDWIEVGLPEERRLRRAAGRSAHVHLYTYGRGAEVYWRQNARALAKLDKLAVHAVDAAQSQALGALAARSMRLQCNRQDGRWWIGDGRRTVEIVTEHLQSART